jgi:hypothetical protein
MIPSLGNLPPGAGSAASSVGIFSNPAQNIGAITFNPSRQPESHQIFGLTSTIDVVPVVIGATLVILALIAAGRFR